MSLDQNLFTLIVTPNSENPNIVDLVDPSGIKHYRKENVPGNVYELKLFDPLSDSLLATATSPSPTSKHKTLQLHNPETVVELKYTGTLSFRWGFKWEDHEFEWKREECFMVRKPDPSVLVAVTKEPAGRLKSTSIQILDYNLNRFDIEDRKGLEIVILTALLTFHDANAATHARDGSSGLAGGLGRARQATDADIPPAPYALQSNALPAAPELPPRTPPRTGVERVAEMHMLRTAQGEGEANEVEVSAEGDVDDYAKYVEGLLRDEAMLFITVRSASATDVPKVLRVVEETKRLRHKAGIENDEELHQYVTYDNTMPSSSSERKAPRRINLDDPGPIGNASQISPGAYTAPNSLVIHLSKIDMPELRPRIEDKHESSEDLAKKQAWERQWARMQTEAAAEARRQENEVGIPKGKGKDKGKGKEDKGKEKGKEKEQDRAQKEREKKIVRDHKLAEKEQRKLNKTPKSPVRPPSGPSNNSFPPAVLPSQAYSYVPPHQAHPYQPTPSPSQLNNPSIYAAPPPVQPSRMSFYGAPQGYGGPPWEAPPAPGMLTIPAAVPRVRSAPGSPEQTAAARSSRIWGRR